VVPVPIMGTDSMGITEDALTQVHALAQTEEPTAEMIAATAAEITEPSYAPLGINQELSGGAGAMYLREIANHDLLTQQDEVGLAQRMEAARNASRELRAADLPDAAESLDEVERQRLEHLVQDGERARRHLIESNLRLVVSVARRYLNRGLGFPRSRPGRQYRAADWRGQVRLAARLPL